MLPESALLFGYGVDPATLAPLDRRRLGADRDRRRRVARIRALAFRRYRRRWDDPPAPAWLTLLEEAARLVARLDRIAR